jgi:hypothetical protein
MTNAFGLRAFTGWAIAITLGGDARQPRILDRRRISLQAEEVPAQFYHVGANQDSAAAASLISKAIETSEAAAGEALAALSLDLEPGTRPNRAGLVVGRAPPARPPGHARLSHAGLHWAEGEAYRWTLLRAAENAGLTVTIVAESDLAGSAAEALGLSAGELNTRLVSLGAEIGPPWTQREKSAALAAWLAMVRG